MKRAGWWASLVALTLSLGGIGLLLTSETALQWLFPRLAAWSGGELTFTQLRGRLIGPIGMTGVSYRTKTFNAHADNLSLDWQPSWVLGATLHLRPLHIEHLVITLPAATTSAATTHRAVRLPFRIALQDAQITHLTIIHPAVATPINIDRIQFSLAAFGNSVRFENAHIEAQDVDAEINGRLGLTSSVQMDLSAQGSWTQAGQPTLTGDAQLRGDRQRLHLVANLNAPAQAQLNATLDTPYAQLQWNAVLKLKNVAARDMHATWPAVQLRGQLTGHGSAAQLQAQGDIEIHGAVHAQARVRLALEHRPATGARKTAATKVISTLADYPMSLDLNWHSLPDTAAEPSPLRSLAGKLAISGVPNQYHFSLNTRLDHTALHNVTLTANGSGDATSLRATAQAHLLDGLLAANGAWRWSEKPVWTVQLRGTNLNPARYDQHWPGHLALTADLRGDTQRLYMRNTHLSGTLRGQPLQLNTRLAIDGSDYTLEHFAAQLGNASASASGSATNSHYALAWDIKAVDLSLLWPDARGGLSSSGRVTGPRDAPRVDARLQGTGLAYRGYAAQRLAWQLDVDMQDKQDSHTRLEVDGVAAPQGDLTALTLQAQGRMRAHVIDLALDANGTKAKVSLHGSFLKKIWTGMLSEAELSADTAGVWRLQHPAALVVGENAIRLAETCLRQSPGQVCADLAWRRPVGWNGSMSAQQFPLSLIQPLFQQDIGLNGKLDAHVAARAPRGGALSATAELHLSPGSVRYPAKGEPLVQVEYNSASAHLQAADGRARSSASLQLKNQGTLDASLAFPLTLPDSRPAPDASLQGNIDAAFHDLSPLALFFPQFYQTRGNLDAHWKIHGTALRPRLSGQLALNNGAADIPRLGLQLRDAHLSLNGDGSDVLRIAGGMHSGQGTLDLDGHIDLHPGGAWSTALHLRGNRFELANTPEIFLLATPDLTLDAQPHTLHLDGNINIPEARIAPKDLASARLASSDVVIVSSATPAAASTKWKIYSRVQLDLGEKIHFSGFNFNGDITGNIITSDEPDRPTTALGELRVVKGQYSIYRQDLNIESGRLIFASGPIDDPGLDIRAVRHAGDVIAGVLARGTLKSPELTLFSQPSMSDTDTLSYLMLGRPADQAGRADGQLLYQAASSLGAAGGELLAKKIGSVFGLQDVSIQTGTTSQDTSLVIGTYLSPRLYINYGIGLLEPVNTFRLRYKLNKHWQFQSESGLHSGADILYTIER